MQGFSKILQIRSYKELFLQSWWNPQWPSKDPKQNNWEPLKDSLSERIFSKPFKTLRLFLCIALCIPPVHNFCVTSLHTWASANSLHNIRDFPQARLNNKIKACFLSNEHGDLYFLSHKFGGVKIILLKLKNYEFKLLFLEGKKR